mmetsp:Transcript_78747/g.238846  ORF Transcript_78747/g.238846 Transcript_78747/m.238846 type:complete len:239 (+) Transcript_78747:538-1254(+)
MKNARDSCATLGALPALLTWVKTLCSLVLASPKLPSCTLGAPRPRLGPTWALLSKSATTSESSSCGTSRSSALHQCGHKASNRSSLGQLHSGTALLLAPLTSSATVLRKSRQPCCSKCQSAGRKPPLPPFSSASNSSNVMSLALRPPSFAGARAERSSSSAAGRSVGSTLYLLFLMPSPLPAASLANHCRSACLCSLMASIMSSSMPSKKSFLCLLAFLLSSFSMLRTLTTLGSFSLC